MTIKIAWVLGVIFVIVAILGFVGTSLVGSTGTFATDMLHNIIHLVTGLIFIGIALKMPSKLTLTFKVIGIVYLVVAVLGFVGSGEVLGLFVSNSADNWLHVVLGIVIAGLGFYLDKNSSSVTM